MKYKKIEDVVKVSSIEEIGEKIEEAAKGKGLDIDKLVSEAIEWARKPK